MNGASALPAATVMSLAAATTLSMAWPAAAASHHSGHPSTGVGDAAKQSQQQHPVSGRTVGHSGHGSRSGIGQGASPSFGFGKSLIEPMPGTYPPNLAGTTFPNLSLEAVYQGGQGQVHVPCLQGLNNDDTHCATESSIPNNTDFTVKTTSGSSVPSDWLLPLPADGHMDTSDPSCHPIDSGHPAIPGRPELQISSIVCDGPTVDVPGTWRHIVITVSDAVTEVPVAGATYDLSGVAPDVPSRGSSAARPSVVQVLETATSDANGQLKFTGWYQGGGFSVQQTKSPDGFKADGSTQSFNVPAVTYTNLGQAYSGAVTLSPLAPQLYDDKSGGAFGVPQTIKVLANDVAVSPPLSVVSVGTATHGTVAISANKRTVTYTPDEGFSGDDTFTYTARNQFGGAGQATVAVIVHPDLIVVEASGLPFTGSYVAAEATIGIGAVLLGMVLTGLGVRRRKNA
jgi:hypothetical protein